MSKTFSIDIWNVENNTYAGLHMWLNGCIVFVVLDTFYKSSKQMQHFVNTEEGLEGLLVHIKLNV